MKISSAITTLTFVFIGAILSQGCNKQEDYEMQAKAYPMMTIKKGSMTLSYEFPATLKGIQDVDIYPQVSGIVKDVKFSEGQAVKKGDTLLTLESMKMENAIMAEADGTVKQIAVTPGQNVMQDDLLIVLG